MGIVTLRDLLLHALTVASDYMDLFTQINDPVPTGDGGFYPVAQLEILRPFFLALDEQIPFFGFRQ